MKRLATTCTSIVAVALLASAGPGTQLLHAQVPNPGVAVAFNPQPDPPGFGIVAIKTGETIHVNVACFDHVIGNGKYAPPCRGVFMFHNAAGATLAADRYDLQPGESAFLTFTLPPFVGDINPLGRLGIIPCVLPAPDSGPGIPSVEVFDPAGHLRLFENPAAPKMADFSNGFTNPGVIVGFNPQPDPPGFGLITVRSDQIVRIHVACFDHRIGGTPPDPCRGDVMFHDAAGNVVARGAYDLQPGEATFLAFTPPPATTGDVTGAGQMSINPCILPAPGGRVVPNVEVVDAATGDTMFLINPAAARVSGFDHSGTPGRGVSPGGDK